MKRIRNLIPLAIKATETHLLVDKENKTVAKEMNGYISSFGASIISSGLLPTIIFYSQKGKSEGDRTDFIDALAYMCKEKQYIKNDENLTTKIKDDFDQKAEMSRLKNFIIDASVALKLAIRTFSKSK